MCVLLLLYIFFVQVWFGEHMFQQNFRFYKGYSIPVYKTTKEYMDFIELLPLVDTPEIFGMHTNADITYALIIAPFVIY